MEITRRHLLLAVSAAAVAGSRLDGTERLERALAGKDVDRPPFSAWQHFGLEKEPPETFARATLQFHWESGIDFVKVMSDYPYPAPANGFDSLRVEENPFPAQIRALELIREGLGEKTYFIETVFNSWSVAEKLTSRETLLDLKTNQPERLIDALEIINRSQINHARRALATGARGIFVAIQNAVPEVLSEEDYAKFSEPFDKLLLSGVSSAPLNILHLHGDHIYWPRFTSGWAAAGINYSAAGTQVPIAEVRRQFGGLILGGIDERNFGKLSDAELRKQARVAQTDAGKRFALTPGCSLPEATTASAVARIKNLT